MNNQEFNHSPLRRSPDCQSQGQTNFTEHNNAEKTEIATNEIKASQIPSTSLSLWIEKRQGESPQQMSWKTVTQPTARKTEKGSRQFFFWETLITVGLLVMALWMQTLPTGQQTERMNSESIQWFEMNNSQNHW